MPLNTEQNGFRPDKESNNSTNVLTWNHQSLQRHPCRYSLSLYRIWRHQLLPVGIYRNKKTAENAASDGFVCIMCDGVSKASSNFSSEEYRHRFRIKWPGVSPSPTFWWASCLRLSLYNLHSLHVQ